MDAATRRVTLYCDTPELVHYAIGILLVSYFPILVDCEGRDIGTTDGALSIISLGTYDASHVFFFDVLRLTYHDFEPLRALLASPIVQKVFWDGRMDAIELRRTLGVSICRPCDLQLADIISRRARGDFNGRKWVKIPWHPLHHVQHLDLEGIHGLTGLKSAPRVHGASELIPHRREDLPMDHERWMERPLPPHYLEYASQDILLLAGLYRLFSKRGYMRPYADNVLEDQSIRYLNIHSVPVPTGHLFLKSNLLPLEVLYPPVPGPTSQCDRCSRWLGLNSFIYPALMGGAMARLSSCKVCFVLAARAEIKAKLAVENNPASPTPAQ